jgi:SAM-dependent methyltransferase
MADWTAGYTADIAYTHGYYNELSPLRARFAFAYAGQAFPTVENACELGFGQGVSVAMHAAASPVHWAGTDFNPAHAAFARQLAGHGGAPVQLSDEAFGEFAQRDDLPQFDFIGMHGIWSWVSDENRRVLVDFLRRKLKVGGVLYVSYNTLPGWAPFAPMRHLLNRYADAMSGPAQGAIARVEGALDFAEKVLATNPLYTRANPGIGERMQKLKGQNKQYLAHEYFNRNWNPMHFADIAEQLHEAKLQFACSASPGDHLPALNLTKPQQDLLNGLQDRELRETVRDYMVNQQFRRDYWVKGSRQLSQYERLEAMGRQRVMLVTARDEVPTKASGTAGTAELRQAVYGPLLDALADRKPRLVAELAEQVKDSGLSLNNVCEAVMMLSTLNVLVPVQEEATARQARVRTEALNDELCRMARTSNDIATLASPLTGGGVSVSRFSQMFLLGLRHGRKTAGDLARLAWALLDAQGQRIAVEGVAMQDPAANLAELERRAQVFLEKELPVLQSLHVAPEGKIL